MQKLFNNVTAKDKEIFIKKLIDHSSPRADFFLLISLSIIMAAFGIIIDSVVVIIGSMLIAPMLYPILSFSLGITMADNKLIGQAIIVLIKSTVISIAISALICIMFPTMIQDATAVSIAISNRDFIFIYSMIAAVAGFAAAFSTLKPNLNDILPGVAIATSLIPPLAVVGYGIARADWHMISSAIINYGTNIVGIIFSSLIVFSLFNLHDKKNIADKFIEKEIE